MKDWLKIVLLAIILLAIVLAARWLIEVGSGEVDVRVQRDTVFVCDTTFIHDTIPKIVYERTVKYIPTPKDTVFVGDSVTFVAADSIPVIQRQYSGNGYEAYTLYALLCDQIRGASVRMLAADSNLSAVSAATNFELSGSQIPSWVNKDKYFVRLGENSYKIKREVTDQIYFEFHNAANIASYNREFDLVVARDLSLSMSADDYKTFLEGVSSKIVSGGVLLLGDNEHVAELKGFDKIENNHMMIYKKK